MLFTIIRDFFVQHVWGGTLSNGTSVSNQGVGFFNVGGQLSKDSGNDYFVLVGGIKQGYTGDVYLRFNDWLSTTSTIITLIVMLICIAYFIRWIFKVVSNSILLR